ncbi:MAG: DNA translocase FtsK, partial [Firmicutes bacterium]|nr:DNA translocase FtsK [Bacillota bacterium]
MPALPELKEEIRTQIKGIIILALAVFCYAGLQFTGQTGEIGLFVNNVLRTLAGETALVIPFLMGVYGLKIMLPQRIINIRSRLTGVLILLLLLTISAHLNMLLNNIDLPAEENFFVLSFKLGLQHQGGGLIGATFASVLYFFFQEIGSLIVIITLASVSVLLITDVSITQFLKYLRKALSLLLVLLKKALLFIKDTYELIGEGEDALQSEGKKKKAESPLIAEEPTEDTLLTESKADKQQYQMERKAPVVIANRESSSYNIESEEVSEEGSSPGEVTKKSSSDYHKPPLLLLTKLKRLGGNQNQNGYMKERIKTLENTLKSFGVKAKVVNVLSGPTVTRFEVQPESGVKVSKISSLSDDLALNLAASDIRIEAPIPGKAAVGIEVPNKVLSPVYLRDVLEDDSFQESPSPLAIGLGQDITGVPVITDLLRMPHLLIAGATGSGKSVCLNCIITSILFKATPQEVKFLMIDPKFVELSIYNGIPHLLAPVVTKPKQAASALKNMVKEMSRRYESFAREGVRDIISYNKLATRSNGEV